jgi:hypothetical protein
VWHIEYKWNTYVVVVRSKVKYRGIKKEGNYMACFSLGLPSTSDNFHRIVMRNNFVFKVAQVPVCLLGKMTHSFEGRKVVNLVKLVTTLYRQVAILRRELHLRFSRQSMETAAYYFFIFSGSAAQRGLLPPRSRGFMITHNYAPQSVGLLWTSDQLITETCT